MKKYFGTDGIRGEVGIYPITPEFALKLGYALGVILTQQVENPIVIIGKDTRISGYLFESSLEAGFSYAGVNVYLAGPIPTPAVAYLIKKLKLSAGVVISASHNSYIDNGIKFFNEQGTKLADKIEYQIEKLLENPLIFAGKLGKVQHLENAKIEYIEFCKSSFPAKLKLQHLKIVLDCANGACYQVAPAVFQELGAEIIKINCTPDGMNINFKCGSTDPSALIKKVLATQADFGIAFDGDGDRVILVDHQGKIYDGDKLIYVILKYYLSIAKPIKAVVGTLMSNLAMEHAITKLGLKFIRSQVGDRYVLEQMIHHDLTLGGEASGHIICLDQHTTGDGIIAILQVLAALISLDQPIAEIVDWVEYPQVMLNVKLVDTIVDWQLNCQELIKMLELELNGNGRVVVRKSGTEPLVRVMVEAAEYNIANNAALSIAHALNNIYCE